MHPLPLVLISCHDRVKAGFSRYESIICVCFSSSSWTTTSKGRRCPLGVQDSIHTHYPHGKGSLALRRIISAIIDSPTAPRHASRPKPARSINAAEQPFGIRCSGGLQPICRYGSESKRPQHGQRCCLPACLASSGKGFDIYASQMQTMLNSPQFLQQMSALMSNPAIIDQIVASNPDLAAMGPRVREVLQSDGFRELLYDPDVLFSVCTLI